ncbi:Uncharacterised protein [Pseudomonas aeruginosa]|nr:Uncharacterised protein [Pseudomonas aeruginosa]
MAGEKPQQVLQHRVRRVLGEHVAGADGGALDLPGPGLPDFQRMLPGGVGALLPEHLDRALQAPAGVAIGLVGIGIDAHRGPVVLAHRVAHGRVAERPAVAFQRLRVVDVAALGHASQGVVEEVLRIGADQALRQVVRLGEEEPVVGVEGEGLVHRGPVVEDRHHGQRDEGRDRLRMVQRQAIADPRAAIVADHREAFEAELAHRFQLVAGQRGLGIVGALLVQRPRFAVATQVGEDHAVVLGQARSDAMPGQVGLRIAMQQQQRRAAALHGDAEARGGGVQGQVVEAGQQRIGAHGRRLTG